MIICNDKAIRVIGYPQSTMTQEFLDMIHATHEAEVITPDGFLSLKDKDRYQYIISLSLDITERAEMIQTVEDLGLDTITVIHDSVIFSKDRPPTIGTGSMIFPFCHIKLSAIVGKHCIIGDYSVVGHYSKVDDGTILRPGVFVLGKSTVGKNCIIDTRSTIINGSRIADRVEILPFSNVVKDIKESGVFGGNQARRIIGL